MKYCTFASCGKRIKGRGLCEGHLLQLRRGKPLTPLRPKVRRGSHLERDAGGRKRCSSCQRWLVEAEFNPASATLDGLYTSCRICHRLKRYTLTRGEFEEMLRNQIHGCLICERSIDTSASVDHDHLCCPQATSCGKCVRGILCHQCNMLLGFVRDDVHTLQRLREYLRLGPVSLPVEVYRGDKVRYTNKLPASVRSYLMEVQQGRCAGCENEHSSVKGKRFSIDHDPRCCPLKGTTCGLCIRGLLCYHCNVSLGWASESPQILESAIKYLTSR